MPGKTTVRIFIDKPHHDVDEGTVKGEFLRGLGPGVPADFDLFLKQPGDDLLVKPDTEVVLQNGMHFYTAKSELTPG